MVWLCITNVARLNGRCKRKSGMITGKANDMWRGSAE